MNKYRSPNLHKRMPWLPCLVLLLISAKCDPGDAKSPVTVAQSENKATKPDLPPNTILAAAIVYAGQHPAKVAEQCRNDNTCAIEVLVRQAHARGAVLVVAPEYGLDQPDAEPDPKVGSFSRELPESSLLARRFASLADELNIYLVVNLETRVETSDYNTQLAFDPGGRLVGKHHKFELYGGERKTIKAGHDVSVFDTPFGKVGLLICADIYGDPSLHLRLSKDLGADIIAFSAEWTVAGAPQWQAAFARDWGVYLIGANGAGGAGGGGGIFDPQGHALTSSKKREGARVLVAPINLSRPR